MSELIKIKELNKFEFEIDYMKNVVGITQKGFARIDIPFRQSKVLIKWLNKEKIK